jgi:hypothetical protein
MDWRGYSGTNSVYGKSQTRSKRLDRFEITSSGTVGTFPGFLVFSQVAAAKLMNPEWVFSFLG